MKPEIKKELYQLLNALREEVITPDQFDRLDQLIANDSEAAQEYLDYIKLWTSLQFFQLASQSSEFLSDLKAVEHISPSIELEDIDFPPTPVEERVIPARKPVHYKWPRRFAAAAVVAIAFSLGFYFSSNNSSNQVATLTDTIGAEWVGQLNFSNGDRFAANPDKSYRLKYGFAELKFDNNAKVTIEGPAEFQITSEDRIKMKYGYAYSTVPPEAIGFSILTPSAMVIDLGTQFGVQISYQGDTELHVLKGKTTLITGKDDSKSSVEVIGGVAKKVTRYNSKVTDIACDERLFVRDIDSTTNLIWRGRPTLNLADIVGGGNGWGSGVLELGIDAITGKIGNFISNDRRGEGKYVSVKNPFIDGVFVPQGKNHDQVITSEGHYFLECPRTNDVCYSSIINGYGKDLVDYEWRAPHGKLGNKPYGTAEYPAIFMHANLGITFDLKAIRESLPEGDIVRFTTDVGLSSDTPREGNFDVWVLVDGELRESQLRIQDPGKVYFFEVPISDQDRFLTLVSTDGEDYDHEGGLATDSDWCVFANPCLELLLEDKADLE